jgi:endogenous inhibitor of DNA gyrase (YacG/DUF329 family)
MTDDRKCPHCGRQPGYWIIQAASKTAGDYAVTRICPWCRRVVM